MRDRLIPLVRFADLLGIVPTYTEPDTTQHEVDRRTRLADRRSPSYPIPGEIKPGTQSVEALQTRNSSDRRNEKGALEIVVVTTGTQNYGLVVGKFHDTEEIVVKPLGSHLKSLEEYAGATILGDGSLALIVDVAGLAGLANLDAAVHATQAHQQAREELQEATGYNQSFVLFHNSPDVPCAVALEAVTRIEQISQNQVETIGGRRTSNTKAVSCPW